MTLAAMFAPCAPAAARAQAPAATDTRPLAQRFADSQRRLDSLSAVWKAYRAAADSEAPPLTMTEGVVHVRYGNSLSTLTLVTLRAAARRATARITAMQGDAASRTIGGAEFIASEGVNPWMSGGRRLEMHLRFAPWYVGTSVTLPVSASRLATFFEFAAADIASNQLFAGIPNRAFNRDFSAVPPAPLDAEAWTDLAVGTASSSSSVARRCLDGGIEDCRRVVLTPNDSVRVEDWYEPADYATMVAQHNWRGESVVRQAIAHRCLDERDAGACSDAAHNMALANPIPVAAARQSLVALALEEGGHNALTRMLDAPHDDRARLAAAAGIPFDSLFAHWQRRVAASRPRHGAVGIIVAALWFATVLFLVARRRPTCA